MRIMVLNDGTTFTSLEGCKIVNVPDHYDTDDIEEGLRNDAVNTEATFHEANNWFGNPFVVSSNTPFLTGDHA